MAPKLNRVGTRMVAIYAGLTLSVLPILALSLVILTRDSLENAFVSHVRSYTRAVADLLETQNLNGPSENTGALLDGVILSGDGVYAHLEYAGQIHPSMLNTVPQPTDPDFQFADHGDNVYFIRMLVPTGTEQEAAVLLGFDEAPTNEATYLLTSRIIFLFLIFGILSILILTLFARRLTRPIASIQRDSRAVTQGDLQHQIRSASGLYEIDGLAHDLEQMRSQLVGMNQQLKEEMQARLNEQERAQQLERQLFQARKLEAIGTLAGGVAHEFNNLLLPMQLNIELALEDAQGQQEIVTSLQAADKSIQRASKIVREILSFGHQSIDDDQSIVDLVDETKDICELLAPIIPANISIAITHPDRPVSVRISVSQLHQIISNLLNNAVHACPPDGGKIDVAIGTAQSHLAPNGKENNLDWATLSVIDQGVGMTEEIRKRALDPFFTTRAVGTGTGLGLSVVQGIAYAAGGSVDIVSSPGEGTRITVYLPLRIE